MNNDLQFRELARRFGFPPTSESVSQLTLLIMRQNCDLDQIASVISRDPRLCARLLRVANPHTASESDYTVTTIEGALMRNGIASVLLLAVGTPLAVVLTKTFQTMLGLELENIDPQSVAPLFDEHVLGTISFFGKAAGRIYLRMSVDSAKSITARITGLNPNELNDPTVINDAVGEVLNIITGNLKSNLSDAGLDSKLRPPQVRHTNDLRVVPLPGGGVERMAFKSGQMILFVDVTINPWNAG